MAKLLELPKAKEPFKIAMNAAQTEADIIIYDDIGADSEWWDDFGVKTLDRELKNLAPTVKNLNVRLNTPGGSVFEGYSIYNRLKQHSATITVFIDGTAASIGSIIAMAGDEIVMSDVSSIMIHNPWTYAMGTATDLEKTAELLEGLKNQMVTVYKKRTGKPETEIRQMMDDETWIFGQDAVDMGFATRMAEEDEIVNAAASVDRSWIKNAPKVPDHQAEARKTIEAFHNKVKGSLARNK